MWYKAAFYVCPAAQMQEYLQNTPKFCVSKIKKFNLTYRSQPHPSTGNLTYNWKPVNTNGRNKVFYLTYWKTLLRKI